LNPQAGQRQTACMRDISLPQRSHRKGSSPVRVRRSDLQRRDRPGGAVEAPPETVPAPYESNESGSRQIYVRPFPNVNGGRWQISTAGGTKPVWARSGRELFYLDSNNFVTGVQVQTTPGFTAGNPARVFDTQPAVTGTSSSRQYDVSRDGQKFVMIRNAPSENRTAGDTSSSMLVVLNWQEELKQRVPTR
jgi:hypothetical protein